MILIEERGTVMAEKMFKDGETVSIKASNESVTILKGQYVKNMKRYSYIVDKYPSTFFFEEELIKQK
ncbi:MULTISPECIES: hypothetical protein [Priestia]|jgi:hypothetical protein|nr:MULTISPECIES: hypothetical protein [Priestia]MBY6088138.1 hypothetical protein [Priestia flexa]